MILDYKQDAFFAKCTYGEKDLAKSAGFRWDPDKATWWTRFPANAMKLYRYATNAAKEQLKNLIETKEESRASETDFQVPEPPGLTLYPFQRAGIEYMLKRDAVLLADQMGCISGDAEIIINRGGGARRYKLRDAYLRFHNLSSKSGLNWNKGTSSKTQSVVEGEFRLNNINNILYVGYREIVTITTKGGKTIDLTSDHKVLSSSGKWKRADALSDGDVIMVNGQHTCKLCGSTENVSTYKYCKFPGVCKKCMYRKLRKNSNYKGGKFIDEDGYVRVSGHWEHPRVSTGGVYEHILVMEQHLGRHLDWHTEQVHHIDNNKSNNELTNLKLVTASEHHKEHKRHQNFGYFIPREDEVISVECVGRTMDVYDIQMESPGNNFVVNGVIVHNCGKTPQVIGVINMDESINRVLIICPASLKLMWRNELTKWLMRPLSVGIADSTYFPETNIVLINYDVLKKWYNKLREEEWDLRVCDECFDYDTEVETEQGKIKIGDIVEKSLDIKVLSCNDDTGELEYKDVIRRLRNPQLTKMITITHEHGVIKCTGNHKIWVGGKYVRADIINSGDFVRVLWNNSNKTETKEREADAAFLLEGVLCTQQSQDPRGTGTPEQNSHNSSSKRMESSRTKQWGFGEHYKKESRPRVCEETERRRDEMEGDPRNIRSQDPWRKWAEEQIRGLVSRAIGDRLATEWHNQAKGWSEGHVPQTADALQSRYHQREIDDSSRNRRTEPLLQGGTGSQERQSTKLSRVLSVESEEQIGEVLVRKGGAGDNFVYNLEVEGNHNYFADNVLVSNCHYLKNPKTQRCQNVLGKWNSKLKVWEIFPIPAKKRIMMTGTPIVNRPSELWSIIRALDPVSWFSYGYFTSRYCAGHMGRWGWDATGGSNLQELGDRLRSTIMIRRMKDEVLTELPPKTRQVIEFDLPDKLKPMILEERRVWEERLSLMEKLNDDAAVALVSKDEAAYRLAVNLLREAQQIVFSDLSRIRHETAVAKLPVVIEYLGGLMDNDQKVVVFAHHADVIAAINKAFPGSVTLTGQTPLKVRQENIDKFQTDPNCMMFIGNIQAAGVGITLTASSLAVFAEQDWVPGNISQCEDRIHRIGAVNPVLIQHLVYEGSIDAKMAKMIVKKQEMIDKVVNHKQDIPEPVIVPKVVKPISKEVNEVLTIRQIDDILSALKILATRCDGAFSKDDSGFNKYDSVFGKSLASQKYLTQKQAKAGKKILLKYHNQLPTELMEKIC